MPVLLTYGDSNTFGTPPLTSRNLALRYPSDIRWPQLCAKSLGPDWTLIEEGLPGRTTAFEDPLSPVPRNGLTGLKIALASHMPVDVLTVMLGTNDVKARFGLTPEAILGGIASLADYVLGPEMTAFHPGLKLLLISPPLVQERGLLADEFMGGRAKSQALGPLLSDYAAARGICFLDAARVINTSEVDGIHYEAQDHATLAKAVASLVMTL